MLGRRRDEAGVTLVELLVATVILGVVTTMLIVGWTNLNRASSSVVSTNQSRATTRDALSRISRELRGAQPTALPTPSSASPTPVAQPPFTMAAPLEVMCSAVGRQGALAWPTRNTSASPGERRKGH